MRNSYCNGFTDFEESEDEKRRKKCGRVLPAKNRRAWTASFTLVDQWLDPGSPGGFRQTNYYKTSPLRNFFVILTFQNGDKRVHCWARCKYCNLVFMHCLFEIFASFVILLSESRFCLVSFRRLVLVFLSLNKQHDLPCSRSVYHRFFICLCAFISFRHRPLLFDFNSIRHKIRIFKINMTL